MIEYIEKYLFSKLKFLKMEGFNKPILKGNNLIFSTF